MKEKKRLGFSLLEVLVAMTILTVIVLIMAGIFKETGIAWTQGLERSKVQSDVRAAQGMVLRDLSMAFDPEFIAAPGTTLKDQSFTKNNLTFYIMRPTPILNATGNSQKREIVKIVYTPTKRTESVFDGAAFTDSKDITFNFGSSGMTFNPLFDANDSERKFPLAVSIVITPQATASLDDYDIGVGSCGPDGEWDTDDDIVSWPLSDK